MSVAPTRLYTWIAGIGLFVQGVSTLAARLIPAVDQALPALLQQTRMIPAHSALHIVSALAAFFALWPGNGRAAFWFALIFGLFYVALALAGSISGHQMGIGLQPFDHSFHAVLGGAGLVAALLEFLGNRFSNGGSR